jgi:uncharacterized repeat protein (TIGR01451 family)
MARHAVRAIALSSLIVLVIGCQTFRVPRAARRVDVAERESARSDTMNRDVLAFPTGERESSVLLVEKVSPKQIRINQPYEYEIRATNLTDGPLLDVVVREQLSDRGTFEITKSEPEFRSEGDWVHYNLGRMAPRETRTVKVTGQTKKEGTITSVIALAAEFKAAMTTEAQVVNPILKLTKEGPAKADSCEGIRYKYTIANVGTGTERDVTIEDALPDGLVTSDGQKAVRIVVGELAQGHSKSFEARVKSARTGTFSSSAVARAPAGAEVRSESVTTTVQQPKLEVAIKGPDVEYLNKTAVYQVTIRNSGDVAAPRAALAIDTGERGALATIRETGERRPAGERREGRDDRPIVAADTAEVDPMIAARREGAELGTLAPGESRTFTVGIRTTREGQLNVSAIGLASCVPPVTQTAKTDVKTLAELKMEITDLDDPIKIGDDVVYRVTVRNQGTGADKNIVVTGVLPSGMQFVEAEGATEGKAAGQNVAFDSLPSLAPGQEATWRIRATANTPGDVRFEVRLKSDTLKQAAVEAEPTKLY